MYVAGSLELHLRRYRYSNGFLFMCRMYISNKIMSQIKKKKEKNMDFIEVVV